MHAWRTRLLRAAILGAVVATPGCGGGHTLARDEVPQLASNQGFIVVAIESNRRVTLTLCRDADMIHCVGFGPLVPSDAMAVSQVPAGRYCIASIVAEAMSRGTAVTANFEAENTPCFDVAPGIIAYPGHLVYKVEPRQGIWSAIDSGWEKRDGVEAQVRSKYPKLAPWRMRTVATHGLE